MRELLQSKTPLTLIAATILASGIGIPISAVFADTNTEHQVTETTTDVNPCTGEPGTLSITYNEIEHQSSDNKGGSHAKQPRLCTNAARSSKEGVKAVRRAGRSIKGANRGGTAADWRGGNQAIHRRGDAGDPQRSKKTAELKKG